MSVNKTKTSFFAKRRNMVLSAVLYTFLWGCAFPLVKICMDSFQIAETDQMSKCLLAGIRFLCSGFLTLLCCRCFGGKIKLPTQGWKYVISYGLTATAIQYAFTYIALSHIDGSKGAIYDQLGIFVIVFTSGLFFKDDKLNCNKLIGCLLGFIGVFIINIDGFSFTFSLNGEGLMLVAVVCQTVSWYIAKGSSDKINALLMVGYGQLIGGIVLCGFSLIAGGKIETVNIVGVSTLVLLILISSVAYTLSLMPLRYFPVSEVSSFNLLITIFGVVMSAALLGENIFKINYLISLLLISCGILLINRRKNYVESI